MDIYRWLDHLSPFQPGPILPEDSKQLAAYKQIWGERKAMLQRAYPRALVILGALLALSVFSLLRSSGSASGMNVMAIVAYWALLFSAVVAAFVRPPRFILLLRRFRQVSRKETLLGNILSEGAWGFANVITIQDKRYKGDISPGYRLISRYYTGFAAVLILIVVFPYLPDEVHATGFWGALVLMFLIWGLLVYAIRFTSQYHCTSESCASKLSTLIARVRAGRFPHSRSTATIRVPDDAWQEAVIQLLDNADCVVIDTTELNQNVEWEVQQAFARLPPQAIMITWAADASETPSGHANTLPEATRERLSALLPAEQLSQARLVSYPRMKEKGLSIFGFAVGVQLAEAMSHRMARGHGSGP